MKNYFKIVNANKSLINKALPILSLEYDELRRGRLAIEIKKQIYICFLAMKILELEKDSVKQKPFSIFNFPVQIFILIKQKILEKKYYKMSVQYGILYGIEVVIDKKIPFTFEDQLPVYSKTFL